MTFLTIGRAAMDKGHVVVLGAGGMLGCDVIAACTGEDFEVHGYDLPQFDITNPQQVERAISEADTVINCAAYTDVDGAERHRDSAQRVNGEAVGQLGRLAARSGKWVLHFSTDFVFDGRLGRPYVETDPVNPINEYGRSKLAGEQFLARSGCSHCIVRLEWTYGAHGKSFITKIIDRAKAGGALKVVDDQVGSPTATVEVAQVACRLLDKRAEGLFHFAAAGYASRCEVARFIVERLSLNVPVSSCRSSDYPSPAQRPLNSRFDCSKIRAWLGRPIRPWQEPLADFLLTKGL
jgi:dTDP-4-dehydrorhamnose reductase